MKGNDTELLAYTHERWNIINAALGLLPVEKIFRDEYAIMKYGLAIDRAFEYGANYFAEWYSFLKANPGSLR